jgi:hypothetical protein
MAPGGNQGQSRVAMWIAENERLRNRGKAVPNEKKKDALPSLSASLRSTLAGKLGPFGSNLPDREPSRRCGIVPFPPIGIK